MSWSWRSIAAVAIAPITEQAHDLMRRGDIAGARVLIRSAYPHGTQRGWPYKAWCKEVANTFPGLYPHRKKSITTGSTPLPMEVP